MDSIFLVIFTYHQTNKNMKAKSTTLIKEIAQKFELLEDSGIQNCHSNGGRSRRMILKHNVSGEKFKISILSESYDFQSYATLYKWSNDGWQQIVKKNPKTDYDVNIAHRDNYDQSAFAWIIVDLKRLALEF